MGTTSADPDRLDQFVADAPSRRDDARAVATSAQALASQVRSRSGNRGVSGTNAGAVLALLENMHANEQFVGAVAGALRTADVFDGVATVDDRVISQLVERGGYEVAVGDVELTRLRLLGEPPNCGLVDDPICAATGNFTHRDPDLVFAGTSATLNLHRFYNSLGADHRGVFGRGWSSVLDVAIQPLDDSTVVARLADGAQAFFLRRGTSWTTSDRRHHRLVEIDDGWELRVGPTGRRSFGFERDGALVNWRVDRTHVAVERDNQGSIAHLRHDRSGRSIALCWEGGLIATASSSDGRRLVYRYDDRQRLIRAESASGWFDYSYADRFLMSAVDPDGVSQFVNTYDTRGRVTRQVSPFGRVTEYHYPTDGTMVVSDERGVRQAMVHDERGNLTNVIDHDGSAMHVDYDSCDRAVAVTAKSGVTWRYEFDDNDNLVRRIDPDQHSQSWSYDRQGRVRSTTDRAGHITRFAYDDDRGSPSRVVAPDGSVTRITLNGWDQPVNAVDRRGGVQTIAWNADGQPVLVTQPDGSETRFEYDAAGRLAAIDRPVGHRRSLKYNAGGRLVEVADGDDHVALAYTPGGRGEHGTTQLGVAWRARYGTLGEPMVMADGLGHETRFEYDSCGNVTRVVAPDGRHASFGYDEVGQRRSMSLTDGATWTFDHDVDGYLVSIVDPEGRRQRRTVDAWGRTLTSTDDAGHVTTWSYHPAGPVASISLPDGVCWRTDVDREGRVVRVHAPGGGTLQLGYSAHDSVDFVELADGRVVDGDHVARRQRLTTPPVGAFERDQRGLVTVAFDPAGLATTIEYDECGRTVSAVAPGGRASTWQYDANGWPCRTVDSAGVITDIERDRSGAVVAVRRGDSVRTAHSSPGVPLIGATTPGAHGERPPGRLGLDSPNTTYAHDEAGRLTSITPPGSPATHLEYGSDGLLTGEIGPRRTARFEHDRGGRVITVDVDGVGVTSISYDDVGRRSTEIGADGTALRFVWDDCDQLIDIVGADSTQRGRFIRLGVRVLDLDTHQFLTADPLPTVIGTNGSASAYTYCWNDPARYCDPSGLRPISIAEYQAIREREEQGRLGQAWEAVQSDPWGYLAVGTLVVVAATVGGPVGGAFVIGALTSAGLGVATGTLSAEAILIGGAVNMTTFGVANLMPAVGPAAKVLLNGAIGAGEELATGLLTDQPLQLNTVAGAFLGGVASGGVAARMPAARTVLGASAQEVGTEVVGSATEQVMTGHHPLSTHTLLAAAGGLGTGAANHHLAHASVSTRSDHYDITPTSVPPLAVALVTGTALTATVDRAVSAATPALSSESLLASGMAPIPAFAGQTGAGVP